MDAREAYLARSTFLAVRTNVAIALWKGGVRNADQLRLMTDKELLDMQGIGEAALKAIRESYPHQPWDSSLEKLGKKHLEDAEAQDEAVEAAEQ